MMFRNCPLLSLQNHWGGKLELINQLTLMRCIITSDPEEERRSVSVCKHEQTSDAHPVWMDENLNRWQLDQPKHKVSGSHNCTCVDTFHTYFKLTGAGGKETERYC